MKGGCKKNPDIIAMHNAIAEPNHQDTDISKIFDLLNTQRKLKGLQQWNLGDFGCDS